MNCNRCNHPAVPGHDALDNSACHIADCQCEGFVRAELPETPGVLPPHVRIVWKQTSKGQLYFECTWTGNGEYSPEEIAAAQKQALDASDALLQELVARSTVSQPETP